MYCDGDGRWWIDEGREKEVGYGGEMASSYTGRW